LVKLGLANSLLIVKKSKYHLLKENNLNLKVTRQEVNQDIDNLLAIIIDKNTKLVEVSENKENIKNWKILLNKIKFERDRERKKG
jgi:hypothetical protein